MRGQVLHYDETHGFGFIAGDDGRRYSFNRETTSGNAPPGTGVVVDFTPKGDRATGVSIAAPVPEDGQAASQPRDPAEITLLPPVPPARTSVPAVAGRPGAPAEATAPRVATTRGLGGAPRIPLPQASPRAGFWGHFFNAVTVNYANFSGRASRGEYWSFALFWFLMLVVVSVVAVFLDFSRGDIIAANEAPVITIVAILAYLAATLVPGIAVSVRRLHDFGWIGWAWLLVLLPSIGMLVALVIGLIPGNAGENRFGPPPA